MNGVDVTDGSFGFPRDGGETGARMRAHDWSASPLGEPKSWPSALRNAITLILASPQSMYLAWGPSLSFFFNDAYRPILGPRLPNAIGKSLPELWPDAWAAVRPMVERTFAGESCRFEDMPVSMARHGVDEETWWTFSYSPVQDEDGTVVGLFCITNETTERVRSVAALRASETFNRQVLDGAVDFTIIATNLDGRVTRWNEGARRVFGWTEAEMFGQPTDRIFSPEDMATGQVEAEMRGTLANGRSNDERWYRRKDGERFWAVGRVTLLQDEHQTAIGFVKVLRDRTAHRRAEVELRERGERLQESEARLSLAL